MTSALQSRPVDRLSSRLAAAASALLDADTDWSCEHAGLLLDQLVIKLKERLNDAEIWLVLTALAGVFPTTDLVLAAKRALELKPRHEAVRWLLDALLPLAQQHGQPEARIAVVSDRVVVDVDFTARHDFLTGIQRVVRETVPTFVTRHNALPVAWTAGAGAFRALSGEEHAYLLNWPGHGHPEPTAPEGRRELVVPWRTKVLLAEVPSSDQSDRLAALARFSGNEVLLVGYDCIPVVSGDLVPAPEREKFGRYLEVVKHADRVAAISQASAGEFAGFCRALSAQGLPGPVVSAVPLPNLPIVPSERPQSLDIESPVVLCVGSLDVRKNQMALLEASEILWQQGFEFTVLLIGGGGGRPPQLLNLIEDLQRRDRKLIVRTHTPDSFLQSAYAAARFTVFPTLHEGFGLPIVESLSHTVPVITSDYGSMRECAEGQGGLLIDPHDVSGLAAAMHALLVDEVLLEELREEARGRILRTWDDYATDLWATLMHEKGDR